MTTLTNTISILFSIFLRVVTMIKKVNPMHEARSLIIRKNLLLTLNYDQFMM